MAGNKLMFNRTVSASTILEVVVSMVIIIVVFGIAMMIFTNVTRMSLSAKKIRAQAALQEALFKAEQQPASGDQRFQADDFIIQQEVKSYDNNEQLMEIHLTAFDANQQQVTELRKIILKP